MNEYINELRLIVEQSTSKLLSLSESATKHRPEPGKWSPREKIGHLIDSATINHQRFVRAQSQDDLIFPGYNQDASVQAQIYQEAPWQELVILWKSLNLQMARTMEMTPDEVRMQQIAAHNLNKIAWQTVPVDEPVTLDYFMNDYVGHLKHHLNQIPGLKLVDDVK